MATRHTSEVIRHLRRTVYLRGDAGLTDEQLLASFLSHRDEVAMEMLVRRHGPMVWGVCRRVLSNHHDAEDAYQATFLVLVRRAASIASRELLANWLYGGAHQTALKARATVAKRKGRERQVTVMPEPAVAGQDVWDDLQPLLDQELSRLPDKYRAVIVLCDLKGKTRQDVARQLGLPEGTVASRLARGRSMLAKRLTQRGVALSSMALTAVLASQVASAGVPDSVVSSTISAASLLAAGQVATKGAISIKVAALTEGVMKAMLFTKLKAAIAVVLILSFVATGATVLCCRTAAQGQQKTDPPKTLPGKEADKPKTDQELIQGTWVYVSLMVGGKDVPLVGDGLPKSLTFTDDKVRSLSINGDGKEVTFQGSFKLNPSRKPKEIDLTDLDIQFEEKTLACLYELEGDTLKLCEPKQPGEDRPTTLESKEGSKHHLWTLKRSDKEKPKRSKENLRSDKPPAAEKPVEPAAKKEKDKDKEGFTAWGKEVGGVQAGLGFRPGEHRVYHHGETALVFLRVRNVGKEAVEFKHIWAFFMENPPSITDADGKLVELPRGTDEGLQMPRSTNVAPGKEVELYEWKLDLQPKGGINKELFTIHGPGKFSLLCERIVGPTTGNPNHPNPTLDKLATGKLELEIKSDPPATEKR